MVNAMLLNEFLKEHRKVEDTSNDRALETAADKASTTITELEIHGGPATETIADCYGASRPTGSPNPKGERPLAAANPFDGGLEASKAAPQVVNNDQ